MLQVEAKDWTDFESWFQPRWERGEHVNVVAPTGAGKSTLVIPLVSLPHTDGGHRHVLGLDPKGGDSTLKKTGWPRITSWPPPRRQYDRMEPHTEFRWGWPPWEERPGEPVRLLVGPEVRTTEQLPRLKQCLADALDGAFDQGHWTVVVDETQVAADQRMMNLTAKLERNYIAARDKGVSMVSLYQAPRRVPRAANDQARWMFVSLSYDEDVIDRLAEQAGRMKAEIRGAVKGLGARRFSWLLLSRDPRDPAVVTMPPKL